MTRTAKREAVVRAAMRMARIWTSDPYMMRGLCGNRGTLAALIRACARLAAAEKRK